jgi:anti-anti-sigma factor
MEIENIVIQESGDETHIRCEGEFTISSLRKLNDILRTTIEGTGDIKLSLTHITAIDVTGIQLLYAWKNQLEASGRSTVVLFPEAKTVNDLLIKTGIIKLF